MPTTTHQPTTAEQRKTAVESDLAPLYALAGLTDLFAEKLRARIAESQERANARFETLKEQPGTLEQQAKHNADAIAAFVRTLPDQLRELPTQARTGIAALQRQAESYRSTAEATYADFAGRGKVAVDGAVVSARQAAGRGQAKGEQVVEDVTEAATEAVDPLLERAQETVTQARKRTTGRTATDTVTPKSTAKAARTTATKATATKATAKKAPAKKAAPATKKASAATKTAPATKAPTKKAAKKA